MTHENIKKCYNIGDVRDNQRQKEGREWKQERKTVKVEELYPYKVYLPTTKYYRVHRF